jgi:L-alanine-DL-glutamate epimerase-like enolase superfamily enzyme
VQQAINIGRRLEPSHLFWLEDVVAHDNVKRSARVAAAPATPIAAGVMP